MGDTVQGKSTAGHRAGQQKPETSRQRDDCGGDLHPKGAMREPAQTDDGARNPLGEVQEALEDLEKEKGDWSKGG